MAVSKYHFPNVKQLGDITKINVDELEPVDIICAGSPCQDLSIAGKREGLAGERSGLFRTAINIVHRLRDRTGLPRYFVWENVCGAFTSNNGFDFKSVLEEITKTEISMPSGGKWAESGMVEWGGTNSLAWRTLDAQHWGCPQRRRRVFLVADFRGFTAGQIFFESKMLPRDIAESQREGKENSTDIGTGINNAGRTGLDIYNLKMTGDKAVTITSYTGSNGTSSGPFVLEKRKNCLTPWDCQSKQIYMPDGVSPTLCAATRRGGGIPPNIYTKQDYSSFAENTVGATLTAKGGQVSGGVAKP
jgi:DNA (cytosine-5)-methyltransferase 1